MEQQPNNNPAPKKKSSKIFIIVLGLLVIGGAWFGFSKYQHGKHHEETDDAQVEANISPVIPRISGYVKEIRVKDNQLVKKATPCWYWMNATWPCGYPRPKQRWLQPKAIFR